MIQKYVFEILDTFVHMLSGVGSGERLTDPGTEHQYISEPGAQPDTQMVFTNGLLLCGR